MYLASICATRNVCNACLHSGGFEASLADAQNVLGGLKNALGDNIQTVRNTHVFSATLIPHQVLRITHEVSDCFSRFAQVKGLLPLQESAGAAGQLDESGLGPVRNAWNLSSIYATVMRITHVCFLARYQSALVTW